MTSNLFTRSYSESITIVSCGIFFLQVKTKNNRKISNSQHFCCLYSFETIQMKEIKKSE